MAEFFYFLFFIEKFLSYRRSPFYCHHPTHPSALPLNAGLCSFDGGNNVILHLTSFTVSYSIKTTWRKNHPTILSTRHAWLTQCLDTRPIRFPDNLPFQLSGIDSVFYEFTKVFADNYYSEEIPDFSIFWSRAMEIWNSPQSHQFLKWDWDNNG